MENSRLSWTDYTFNPWQECTKVNNGSPNGTRAVLSENGWKAPLKWNNAASGYHDLFSAVNQRNSEDNYAFTEDIASDFGADSKNVSRRLCEMESKGMLLSGKSFSDGGWTALEFHRPRVFCASLADVFEDWEGFMHRNGEPLFWSHSRQPHESEWHWILQSECAGGETMVTMADVRARLFRLIDATPNLDWILLTKRPENIRSMIQPRSNYMDTDHADAKGEQAWHYRKNVWLGTSCSDQETADKAIPELLKCRHLSPVIFLLCEPLGKAYDGAG